MPTLTFCSSEMLLCDTCDGPCMPDPDGSPGVLVHMDDDGRPDYARDRDHTACVTGRLA